MNALLTPTLYVLLASSQPADGDVIGMLRDAQVRTVPQPPAGTL